MHTPASVQKRSNLHQWKQKNKPVRGGGPHQTTATTEQQLLQAHSSNHPKPAMLKTETNRTVRAQGSQPATATEALTNNLLLVLV
jgi:hypothetical protein